MPPLRNSIRDGLLQFYRNNRWGTCVDCPRDSDGKAYPEFCCNTTRHDHRLTMTQLASQINNHNKVDNAATIAKPH